MRKIKTIARTDAYGFDKEVSDFLNTVSLRRDPEFFVRNNGGVVMFICIIYYTDK